MSHAWARKRYRSLSVLRSLTRLYSKGSRACTPPEVYGEHLMLLLLLLPPNLEYVHHLSSSKYQHFLEVVPLPLDRFAASTRNRLIRSRPSHEPHLRIISTSRCVAGSSLQGWVSEERFPRKNAGVRSAVPVLTVSTTAYCPGLALKVPRSKSFDNTFCHVNESGIQMYPLCNDEL